MEKLYQFYALSEESTPQNFRYIGVTSKEINQRFAGHKYCAMHETKRNCPVHKWMYSVYKKGGNIIYTKIAECSENNWEETEKKLISKYKESNDLLNIDDGGRGVITKEKRNISGIQRSIQAHNKSIVLFNLKGDLVDICNSLKEACEKYKLNRTSIGNVLHGRSKTCGGYYIVSYKQFNDPNFDIKSFINNSNNSRKKQKVIYQFDLQGNLLQCFKSKREANLTNNLDQGALYRSIKNKTIYKNSYWSYDSSININEFKSLYKYKYNNKLYKSQKDIGKDLNLAKCTISAHVVNKIPINGMLIETL